MITCDLMQSGLIRGVQAGHEWRFWLVKKRVLVGWHCLRLCQSQWLRQLTWHTHGTQRSALLQAPRLLGEAGSGDPAPWPPDLSESGRSPGLYRFRIRGPVSEAIYIGESENLVWRFRYYSNPGPSQQTNIRLNAKFYEALSNGTEIGVAIVTVGAWTDFERGPVSADFHSKAVRRLFESAAIVQGMGGAIESLNL